MNKRVMTTLMAAMIVLAMLVSAYAAIVGARCMEGRQVRVQGNLDAGEGCGCHGAAELHRMPRFKHPSRADAEEVDSLNHKK